VGDLLPIFHTHIALPAYVSYLRDTTPAHPGSDHLLPDAATYRSRRSIARLALNSVLSNTADHRLGCPTQENIHSDARLAERHAFICGVIQDFGVDYFFPQMHSGAMRTVCIDVQGLSQAPTR
jgi:hypothetical protein